MNTIYRILATAAVITFIAGLMTITLKLSNTLTEAAIGSVIVIAIAILSFSLIQAIPKDSK